MEKDEMAKDELIALLETVARKTLAKVATILREMIKDLKQPKQTK